MHCFGGSGGFAQGCHFTELTPQCIMGINVIQLTSKNYHESILASLQQLRMEGHLTDVTVQVDHQGHTEEYQAHKLMLAASSGYFKAAFASQEVVQEKISLLALHNEQFSKFLEFVYTGKIELTREKIGDVLAVAECLDCKELADVCRDALTAGIVHDAAAATIYEPTVVDTDELHALIHGKKSQGGKRKRQPKKLPKQPLLSADKEVRGKVRKAKATASGQSQRKRLKVSLSARKVVQRATRQKQIFYNDTQGTNQDSDDVEAEDQQESLEHQEDVSLLAMPSFDTDEDWEDGTHNEDSDEALQLSARDEEDQDKEESKGRRKKTTKAQFACTKCQRTFHYERSYLKHISTYHGVQADVVYRCETCQQTFANRSNLKIHEKHVHSSERLFSCESCMKAFKRKKDVVRHQRQVHERSNLRHICTLCGKALSSKTALQMHERTHTGAKPFECTECGTKFSQNSALKMHRRIHTGEKPFACDQCDSRFTQKHMLVYHKRLHTGEKPFMCEACGKSFASKEYLRHHSNIHTGSRPYKCEQCGRCFAQRNSLHQHLKIHTGERPYSCKDCDKQFTQLNALQRHQRIHTGEKPYMCSLCSRTFTDRSTLRRHTAVHDPDAPWKTYLIVLEGNVEDKKTAAWDKAGTKEKKRKGKKTTTAAAAAPAADDAGPEEAAEKSQSNSIVVSTEAVALPADWASGAIAVVSHGAAGGIAVIHADGTQIQPVVTSDCSGIISLDGSAIPVPFSENPALPAASDASVVDSQAILPSDLQSAAPYEVAVVGGEETTAEGQRTSDEPSAEQEAAEDQV